MRIAPSRSRLALWVLALTLGGASIWLMLRMPGRSHSGPLPPLTREQAEVSERLRLHVERLAGEIGERNLWRPAALEEAAAYVEAALGERTGRVWSEPFTAEGRTVRNVLAEREGIERPEEIVVVGAHYDSVIGSPGANDNASGVAALLELARLLEGTRLARTLRLAAFVNEEPPFYLSDAMGSLRHARGARQRGEAIVGMLSLETDNGTECQVASAAAGG